MRRRGALGSTTRRRVWARLMPGLRGLDLTGSCFADGTGQHLGGIGGGVQGKGQQRAEERFLEANPGPDGVPSRLNPSRAGPGRSRSGRPGSAAACPASRRCRFPPASAPVPTAPSAAGQNQCEYATGRQRRPSKPSVVRMPWPYSARFCGSSSTDQFMLDRPRRTPQLKQACTARKAHKETDVDQEDGC